MTVNFVVTSHSQNCTDCKNSKNCDNKNNKPNCLKRGTVCIADAIMHPNDTYGMASGVAANQTPTIFRIFMIIQYNLFQNICHDSSPDLTPSAGNFFMLLFQVHVVFLTFRMTNITQLGEFRFFGEQWQIKQIFQQASQIFICQQGS